MELFYTCRKRIKKALGVWPAFPITVASIVSHSSILQENLLAVLEHHNRVRVIILRMMDSQSQLDEVAMAMQQPLTVLRLGMSDWPVPILPNGFLGESAPSLRDIHLTGISFPALPRLLLSTRELTDLYLDNISLDQHFTRVVGHGSGRNDKTQGPYH
jgi:hypothetical protein